MDFKQEEIWSKQWNSWIANDCSRLKAVTDIIKRPSVKRKLEEICIHFIRAQVTPHIVQEDTRSVKSWESCHQRQCPVHYEIIDRRLMDSLMLCNANKSLECIPTQALEKKETSSLEPPPGIVVKRSMFFLVKKTFITKVTIYFSGHPPHTSRPTDQQFLPHISKFALIFSLSCSPGHS
ncbi:hypothetical protein J6590_067990 [Homalodisca vitripennis]|nr:hypothetical protein J6590_067990 [Homalodisca vitripennis]